MKQNGITNADGSGEAVGVGGGAWKLARVSGERVLVFQFER